MKNIIAGFKQTYGTAFAITSSVIIVMGMLFNESIASMMLAITVMYPVVCLLMALDVAYPCSTEGLLLDHDELIDMDMRVNTSELNS